MRLINLLSTLLLLNCTPKQSNLKTSKKTNAISVDTTKIPSGFNKLEKLSTVGDFDGDNKTDTIYQHNYSKLEKKEIDFAPDPIKTDREEFYEWFSKQDANVYLKLNQNKENILNLGNAQGLYCLINIGDNNKDGKDEIAFVIDECDYSRTNTCKIYTLCNGKWQLLKEFGIREDAFDGKKGKSQSNYNSIKGYLEKQNNVWKYLDNNQNEYDSPEEVGQMKVLKLDKCK